MKGLVSIITPCYNGSSFVHRLLDSVLEQTYPFIEMYFIDDGSTDNTAEIVKSYIPKFELKGYVLNYIYQENSGQSVALNKGLKLVKGEYLTWPDSDDFYATNYAIEKMAITLSKSNGDVGVVRSSVNLLDEITLKTIGSLGSNIINKQEVNLFDDSVFERKNFWFQPISYMVRFKYVTELIKDKEIFTKKDAGQNWQILLPIFYKYKCCLLAEKLSNVLVRPASHSKGNNKSFENIIDRYKVHQEVLENTIQRMVSMPNEVKENYLSQVDKKYLRIKFELAKRYSKTTALKETYKTMRVKFPQMINNNDKKFFRISQIPFLLWIVIVINKIFRKLKKLGLLILVLSLIVNILFFSIDILPFVKKVVYKKQQTYLSKDIEIHSFENLVLAGAKKRLSSDIVFDNDYYPTSNFILNVKNCFLKNDIVAYEYGEHGYLMWETLKYVIKNNDEVLIKQIKNKFDKAFLTSNSPKINRVDQAIYGCIAIELFKKYKDPEYKNVANFIYQYLKEIDEINGLITYNQGEEQHVDVLGFICPFLVEYANYFNVENANLLALKVFDDYAEFGADFTTGLPSQGYNISNKLKIGYSNWGRGFSWYALALSYLDVSQLKELTQERVLVLNKTLKELFLQDVFTQFPGKENSKKMYDMSVQIPLMYYLHDKKLIEINKSSLVQKYAQFVTHEGLIVYNSPSITSGRKPSGILCHDMTQGVLIGLLSKTK